MMVYFRLGKVTVKDCPVGPLAGAINMRKATVKIFQKSQIPESTKDLFILLGRSVSRKYYKGHGISTGSNLYVNLFDCS